MFVETWLCRSLILLALLAGCRSTNLNAPNEAEIQIDGQSALSGGIETSYTATHDYWNLLSNEPVAANHRLFTIHVEFRNVSRSSYRYSPQIFRVELADSSRWSPISDRQRQPSLGSGILRLNQSSGGWLTFEVPDGPPITAFLWQASADTTVVFRFHAPPRPNAE